MLRGAIVGLRDEKYAETRRLLDEGFPPNSTLDLHVSMLLFALAILAAGLRDLSVLQRYRDFASNSPQFVRAEFFAPLWFPCYLIHLADAGQHNRVLQFMHTLFENGISYAGLTFPMDWARQWALLSRLRANAADAIGEERYRRAWEAGAQISGAQLQQEMRDFLGEIAN